MKMTIRSFRTTVLNAPVKALLNTIQTFQRTTTSALFMSLLLLLMQGTAFGQACVGDVTPPVITCAPNVTVNACATVALTPPTVTDNCPNSSLGNALSFDGANDFIRVPSFTSPNTITLETWVNIRSNTGYGGLISKWNEAGNQLSYELGLQGQRIYFVKSFNGSSIDGSLYTNALLGLNTWYHVCATYDGTIMKVYLDGNLINQLIPSNVGIYANSTIPLALGATRDGTQLYFNGRMDEVRIWNVARTQAEIQANMKIPLSAQTDLIAAYHFDEGIAGGSNPSVTTTADASGNGRTGTLNNFALTGTTSNWVAGQSFEFPLSSNAPTSYPKGNTTVTWTATDASGNTATCQQVVTAVDNQLPTLAVANRLTRNCFTSLVDPITDNCTGATWGYTLGGATTSLPVTGIPDGSASPLISFSGGITTVTLSGVDASGNVALTKTYTVTIESPEIDIQGGSPLVSIPDGAVAPVSTNGTDFGNVDVNSSLVKTFTIRNIGRLALNISSITSNNVQFTIGAGIPTSIGVNGSATFNVTFLPTASGSKNTIITINSNDCNEAVYDFVLMGNGNATCLVPTITCPSNQNVNTDLGVCTAVVNYATTVAGTPTPSVSYVFSGATTGSGSGNGSDRTFNKGVTNVILTATNSCGTTTCSFTVTVNDITPPVLTAGANQNVNLDANCQITVPDVTGSATDNCSSVTITQTPSVGTLVAASHNGTVNITVTATDGVGLTDIKTVVLTAKDVTAPVLTAAANQNVSLNDDCKITVPDVRGSATDLCSGVTITQTPSVGTLVAAAHNGTVNVTVTATDGAGLTDIKTVVLTANDVIKPTFTRPADKSIYTAANCTYNADPSVTGDVMNESDNCSTGIVATYTDVTTNGAFACTKTITRTWSLVDNVGNAAADQVQIINVLRRPTTLSYTGDGSEQYSDNQTFTAVLIDNLTNTGISGKTITFTMGTQTTTAVTDASGIATVGLVLTQAPNTYTVSTSYTGDNTYVNSADSDPFTINKEDARVTYTGVLFASTANATTSNATVTLTATIQDITAAAGDPATDGYAGDIRNAKVTFVNRDAGNAVIAANLPIGLVNASDTKTGTAIFNWAVNIGASASETYHIGIIVTNYYTRNSGVDNTEITVSKPLDDFVTGGGYLTLTNSNGLKSGDAGTKCNFGFNVKYNKSSKSLQGNINTIFRRTEGGVLHTYQIKGNAMTSLAISSTATATTRLATYTGKANLQDVTDPNNVISISGNATLKVDMTDKGDPGSTDEIAITVFDNNGGLWFSSNWSGTATNKQVLTGGNIQVRGGGISAGSTTNPLIINNSNRLFAQKGILIYPSVVEDELTIESGEPIDNVFVFNAVGQLVLSSKDARIRLSALQTGIYIVRVEAAGETMTQKVFKQ